tara:strand:+ start:70 stop:243 length:174 start_codon:yes stop_codon:yes gene_type:complete
MSIKTRREYTFKADSTDNDVRVRVMRRCPSVGPDWFHVREVATGYRFVTHAQHLSER